MKTMLEFRERFEVFYNKNNVYVILLLKFIVALFFFLYINKTLGFMEPLNSIFIVLVLALICSLLSFFTTLGIGFLLVVGHCYAIGIEVAAVALVLLLVLLIFCLRMEGEDSVGAILTPLAFMWNIPFAIPMGLGLLRGPTSAFAAVCGTLFYYFMKLVRDQASTIRGIDKSELAKKVKILVDGLIQNEEMWMTIVVSVAVVLVIYSLRRMAIKFAWDIAIVTGGIAYLVVRIGASTIMDLEIFFSGMLLQVIVVCSLGFLIKFFVFDVDYTRTESLQYEDDDYYYYVKAIPKINVTRERRLNKSSDQSQKAEE